MSRERSRPWELLEATERELMQLATKARLVPDATVWRQKLQHDEHLNRDEVAAAIESAVHVLRQRVERSQRRGAERSHRAIALEHAFAHLGAEMDRVVAGLVSRHIALVHHFAKRYASRYEHDDLAQEGCLGLIRAIQKFEHWRGVRFSTYASNWIRQAMQRAVRQKAATVRVPIYQLERGRMIGRVVERHRTLHGRAPTPAEIAWELRCPVEDVAGALTAELHPFSLDAFPGWSDGVVAAAHVDDSALSPEAALAIRNMADLMRDAVSHLTERDRRIIESRFGFDGGEATLAEVGAELGLSRERVRQLESAALARLRRRLGRRLRAHPA